jgi:hypothetical protein
MKNQRGSTTIMALTAMLVLSALAASFAYVTRRNVDIAANYAEGLQAQYTAESAIQLFYVAGQESVNPNNGWQAGQSSSLAEWDGQTWNNIVLPMGTANVTVSTSTVPSKKSGQNTYKIQAVGMAGGVNRLAYVDGMDIYNTGTSSTSYNVNTVTTASLIHSGNVWTNEGSSYPWQLPADLSNTTSPAVSPGSTDGEWPALASQVLFNDSLGMNFSPQAQLSLVFRVNYYITLTKVPNASGDGSGYGIYYLAKKSADQTQPGDPSNPTAYVVQYDPGLHPGYGSPPGSAWPSSNNAWGAAFGTNGSGNAANWPYGAFLVKKVWNDGKDGWQNEVWDKSGGYNDSCAFQDNIELTQRYFDSSGNIQPNLDAASLANTDSNNGSVYSRWWALQPAGLTPGLSQPVVMRVPTAFGYDRYGNYDAGSPELTPAYDERPPDLRIAYTLGALFEGNPWQAATYYPGGAKVTTGAYVNDPIDKRLMWVAATAGVSGNSNPFPADANGNALQPQPGQEISDGGVLWIAQAAPTPLQVAETVLNSGISIAKISMADLNFRINSVNGTVPQNDPYGIPFTMLNGSKNKITIELWADNQGNRIHVIRVNDVVVLAFNDRYESYSQNPNYHAIIGQGWEQNPALDPRGTGVRVWNAVAEFYTADNYGQTIQETYTTNSSEGIWGR